MAAMRNRILLLLWLTTLFALGLLFFSRGFLLKRITLHHRNICNNESNPNSCRFPPSFSRSVFIIIDGLRYDFARWNETATNPKPYQNKLLTINQVLTRHPDRSRLFKFIADPPTTTMQRIKALTTGSLPTFVDMGSNFASYEINEDNLIDQLIDKQKKIIFMGDDTWISLFPDKFYDKFPFPSFNVKDLDTVDNGILQRLIPTMKNDDWGVIIAHFLGVDHCGHTFGPDHPIMGQKLNQLDLILKSVVSNLREDTVLFVLGDHGMSATGDHGGESVDEVSSALFVYSGGRKFDVETKMESVNQIDLVPSVSLLLGTAIPFGNLGSVITDLIPRDLVPLAYFVNCFQVNRYLSSYVEVADDFSKSDWIRLRDNFKEIETNFDSLKKNSDLSSKFIELTSKYLEESVSMCRRIWATFDTSLMFIGIVYIILGIICAFLMSILTEPTQNLPIICLLIFSILLFVLNLILPSYLTQSTTFYITFTTPLVQFLIFIFTIRSQITLKIPNFDKTDITSTLILLIVFSSPFSNSFIINEASTLSFLTNFLILITSLSFQPFKPQKRDSTAVTLHQRWRLIFLLLFALTSRLSLNLQRCRNEQFWCKDFTTYFSQPPLWLPVITVSLIPFLFLYFLRRAGNLNANSFTVLSVKYLTGICCACICYSWALASLPLKLRNLLSSWQEIWFPRVAFLCLFVEFVSVLIYPIFVYLLSPSDATHFPGIPSSSITDLFNYFKTNWRHLTADQTKQLPVVYGLATVYSAPILVITMIVSLLSIVLLGQIHSLSIIFLLSSLFLSLTIVSLKKTEFTHQTSDLFKVSWPSILIWSLQSSLFFFVTGHQSTISSIQWNAAFVGVDDDMTSHVIPAIKILFNTFASQLIFSISLQLLPIWPFTLHILFPSIGFQNITIEQIRQGEMTLFYNQDELKRESFRCTTLFIAIRSLKLLSAILSAALHRRHLMVWELFAPRFLFESISFILSLLASYISFGLIARTNTKLNQWINLLEKRSQ